MTKKKHSLSCRITAAAALVKRLRSKTKAATVQLKKLRAQLAAERVRYVDVQGCPVPRQLATIIVPSLAATGATLTSCYRGNDPQGVKILEAHGKHTQQQLYEGWLHHLPGYLPANRPGTSTHELRSDGVAYAGPVGRVLEWWQCGMDIDDYHVDAFIRHLAGRGVTAHRPYPSGSEHHHVNLSSRPRVKA
jgi:hypothetical protein